MRGGDNWGEEVTDPSGKEESHPLSRRHWYWLKKNKQEKLIDTARKVHSKLKKTSGFKD